MWCCGCTGIVCDFGIAAETGKLVSLKCWAPVAQQAGSLWLSSETQHLEKTRVLQQSFEPGWSLGQGNMAVQRVECSNPKLVQVVGLCCTSVADVFKWTLRLCSGATSSVYANVDVRKLCALCQIDSTRVHEALIGAWHFIISVRILNKHVLIRDRSDVWNHNYHWLWNPRCVASLNFKFEVARRSRVCTFVYISRVWDAGDSLDCCLCQGVLFFVMQCKWFDNCGLIPLVLWPTIFAKMLASIVGWHLITSLCQCRIGSTTLPSQSLSYVASLW